MIRYFLVIKILDDGSIETESFLISNNQALDITGNILPHKLIIGRTDKAISPDILNFGRVFFKEKVIIPITIKNLSNDNANWIITYAEELTTRVPDIKNFNQDQDFIEDMTVYPNEGILGPHETKTVDFTFNPTEVSLNEIKTCNVSMVLKILGSERQLGQDPITFSLFGEACISKFSSNSKRLQFPITDIGEKSVKSFILKNDSSYLPVEFKIKRIAHYNIEPEIATVNPNKTAVIKVTFKPNQLGQHDQIMECEYSSQEDRLSRKRIEIQLCGLVNTNSVKGVKIKKHVDLPSSAFKVPNIKYENSYNMISSQSKEEVVSVPFDWDLKVANKIKFIEFLRMSHKQHCEKKHAKIFGNDISVDLTSAHIDTNYSNIDPLTGLDEPQIDDMINNKVSKSKGLIHIT